MLIACIIILCTLVFCACFVFLFIDCDSVTHLVCSIVTVVLAVFVTYFACNYESLQKPMDSSCQCSVVETVVE